MSQLCHPVVASQAIVLVHTTYTWKRERIKHVVIDPSKISVICPVSQIPQTLTLSQNYPNPFNSTTTISYQINKKEKVNIEIYNISGEHIITLVNNWQEPGEYKVVWNGKRENGEAISSGIYFIKLKAGNSIKNKKMILIK